MALEVLALSANARVHWNWKEVMCKLNNFILEKSSLIKDRATIILYEDEWGPIKWGYSTFPTFRGKAFHLERPSRCGMLRIIDASVTQFQIQMIFFSSGAATKWNETRPHYSQPIREPSPQSRDGTGPGWGSKAWSKCGLTVFHRQVK